MFGQHTKGDCASREERVVLQRQFLSTFCQLAPTKVRRRQLFPLRVRSNAEFFLGIARLGRRLPKAREESGEGERQRRQDQSNDDDDGRFHNQHSLRGKGSTETEGSKAVPRGRVGVYLGWWTHSLLETIDLRWALLAGGEALTGRGHRDDGGRCDGND